MLRARTRVQDFINGAELARILVLVFLEEALQDRFCFKDAITVLLDMSRHNLAEEGELLLMHCSPLLDLLVLSPQLLHPPRLRLLLLLLLISELFQSCPNPCLSLLVPIPAIIPAASLLMGLPIEKSLAPHDYRYQLF